MWTQGKAVKNGRLLIKQGMSKRNAYRERHGSKEAEIIATFWGMVTVLRNKIIIIEWLRSQDEYYLKLIHVI